MLNLANLIISYVIMKVIPTVTNHKKNPPIFNPLSLLAIFLIKFSTDFINFPMYLTGWGNEYGSPIIKSVIYPMYNDNIFILFISFF